jgi:5-methylcytosine-specific restriction endonuclease McrA
MEVFKTLKLDASFRPVEVIDAIEALVLCIVGKAAAIENYSDAVKTVTESFALPSVIALKRVVKFKFTTMACKRPNIMWRDDYRCQYCAKHLAPEKLTIDHVIPRSKGGKNTWFNLVTACKKCNQKKGNFTPEQAGMKLIRPPYRPKTHILRTVKKSQIAPVWKEYLWNSS